MFCVRLPPRLAVTKSLWLSHVCYHGVSHCFLQVQDNDIIIIITLSSMLLGDFSRRAESTTGSGIKDLFPQGVWSRFPHKHINFITRAYTRQNQCCRALTCGRVFIGWKLQNLGDHHVTSNPCTCTRRAPGPSWSRLRSAEKIAQLPHSARTWSMWQRELELAVNFLLDNQSIKKSTFGLTNCSQVRRSVKPLWLLAWQDLSWPGRTGSSETPFIPKLLEEDWFLSSSCFLRSPLGQGAP